MDGFLNFPLNVSVGQGHSEPTKRMTETKTGVTQHLDVDILGDCRKYSYSLSSEIPKGKEVR